MIEAPRPYHDEFGPGRHQLGSRFIDPNRIARNVPRVTFTLNHIAEAAKALPDIEHIESLKHNDVILVALPEVSLSFAEVVRLCPTDNPTLRALIARFEVECDVDIGTYTGSWFTANRNLTAKQLRRQNAAALLWAELAQFYGRDNRFPLRVH